MRTLSTVLVAAASFAAPLSVHAEPYTMEERDIRKVEPVADRDQAKPFRPTWCKSVAPPGATPGSLGRTAGTMIERGYSDVQTLSAVAVYLCDSPDDPGVQRQAGYVIQKWMNWTGLAQPEAIASFAARARPEVWEKLRTETCAKYVVGNEDSRETATLAAAHNMFYGCGTDPAWEGRQIPDNLLWYVDRAADPPSELLRTLLVLGQLPATIPPSDDILYPKALRGFLLASMDAAKLDPAKLEGELTASGANEYAKWIARENMARARVEARRWKAHVEAAAAKDPDLAQLLIELPKKTWADWEALRQRAAPVFDEGEAFEKLANSPSLSAVKGCQQRLRPTVTRLLKELAPGDPKTAAELVKADPVAGPAFARFALCAAMEKDYPIAEIVRRNLSPWRAHRGPRLAVYFAAVESVGTIVADRPQFVLQPRNLVPPASDPIPHRTDALAYGKTRWFEDDEGIVASVKKVPGGVLLTFKKESHLRQDWSCTPTNKIARISDKGDVEYYNKCKTAGTTEVETTAKPVIVPETLAGGIRAGRFVQFSSIAMKAEGEDFGAVPLAVYESKAQKKLVALWGFEL